MSKFGAILSSLRREKGLSQREVSSHLGISQALLSHYENSAREPKLEFVVKACEYYDVSVDYILGRDSDKKPRVIPVPHDCKSSPRFLIALDSVFDILADLGDPELFSDAIDFLSVSSENLTLLLSDPSAAYEPSRDIKTKLAEKKLVERGKLVRGASAVKAAASVAFCGDEQTQTTPQETKHAREHP